MYFDDDIDPGNLDTVMRCMGVRMEETNFFVVCESAAIPPQEQYLDQIRIIGL